MANKKKQIVLGIADTTFSRVDMFKFVQDEVKNFEKKFFSIGMSVANSNSMKKSGLPVRIVRYTVPGIKDLPVACKILLDKRKCGIAIALGMVGGAEIDERCAHEANIGIQFAQLMSNKHIIGVFVHWNEAKNEADFYSICENRTRKHTQNALLLASGQSLSKFAGMGKRQGREDEGRISK
jgi:riboflavin synthase